MVPVITETETFEQLFPLVEGEELPIEQSIDIADKLRIIRHYQKQQEELEAQYGALMERYNEWYTRRIQAAQKRIDFHLGNISNFMKQNGLRRFPTPEGTPYFKKTDHFTYPEDEKIIEWAKAHAPEIVKTKEYVPKDLLKKHIHATGSAPEGYEEKSEKQLLIKESQ